MRMTGADFRDVSPNVTLELIPGHASALTPSPERVQPCPADLGSVHAEPFQVPGDRVVVQVSLHHAGEPSAGLRDWRMATFHQIVSNGLQRRSHTGGDGQAPDGEVRVRSGHRADVREPEEVERFRAALPPACAAFGRIPSKFQNPRLLLVQRKTELRHPLMQGFEKALSFGLCFEAHDTVVRVADDDDISFRRPVSPLVRPEIEDVVQVDIGQERRGHALNAKDNFRFERTIIGWRGWGVLDLRHKR